MKCRIVDIDSCRPLPQSGMREPVGNNSVEPEAERADRCVEARPVFETRQSSRRKVAAARNRTESAAASAARRSWYRKTGKSCSQQGLYARNFDN